MDTITIADQLRESLDVEERLELTERILRLRKQLTVSQEAR